MNEAKIAKLILMASGKFGQGFLKISYMKLNIIGHFRYLRDSHVLMPIRPPVFGKAGKAVKAVQPCPLLVFGHEIQGFAIINTKFQYAAGGRSGQFQGGIEHRLPGF